MGQTAYSGRTEEEFEQDVATLGAHKLASNPVLGADKGIRTELCKQISLHDQVKYRGPNGTTAMSYKEAYALQKQTKSRNKMKESLLHGDVPDGSSFLANSNKKKRGDAAETAIVISENPSAKDPHRARRNKLANSQIKPPVFSLDDSPDVTAAAPDEMRGIHSRLRKRAATNIKAHKNNKVPMTPGTFAKTRVVHKGLTSGQKDPYITSCVADELDGSVEFASSQDVLKGITDTIETPMK